MYRSTNKTIFPAALAACLLLVACRNTAAIPNAPSEQTPVPLPEPPAAEHTEELRPDLREPKNAPSVWDVSDTDISHIDGAHKLISFTFDDAPSRTLENILAVFAAFNEENPDFQASATVFCNGYLINNSSMHTLQTAAAMGIELGNHSQTHPDLSKLTREELKTEIGQTDELLSKIDGKPYHLFRAPFGRLSEDVRALVPAPVLDWTIDTLDWKDSSAEDIYNTVWSQKFSGAIVLMHDGYENTVTALKRLLPDLKREGYQAVSLSQMSKAHDCPLKTGSVYIRIRKNGTGA